jgi:Fe2+ transport system protein FeoA
VCDIRHCMEKLLEMGCPPGELIEITMKSLAAVVPDNVEVQHINIGETAGVVH